MTERKETNRQSSQQESLIKFIAGLFELAENGKNPTSLIEAACQESGLSPNGEFTKRMTNLA